MKVNLSLLILLICLQINLKGQNLYNKFGRIEQYEVDLKECNFDKLAEAIKIFDIGKSYFERKDNSFDVIYERTTRIKIFTEAGIKWAEIEIPIYQEGGIYELVYDLEAYTYNFENGRQIKTMLDPKTCYEEKLNEYWKLVKFAMPDVKKGSIIEYKYKISSEYLFNLRDWEFQSKIPTIHSQYEVRMIPFYAYSWILQGATQFHSRETHVDHYSEQQFGPVNYKENVDTFVLKNIPAFKSENFITSINDYIIKLDFQLSKIIQLSGAEINIRTTWAQMIKDLLKHSSFGKYVRKSEKLLSKVFPATNFEDKSQSQKFDLILNYAKQNFNWNNTNSQYSSVSPSTFLKNKHGNSADINLFVIGLLNEAQIEAHPVLISTRAHGKIKANYPYSHFFNYVLISVKINDETFLTDATESLISNRRIPPRCINDKGLVINKEKIEWLGLQSLISSKVKTEVTINLIGKKINAKIKAIADEYEALNHRNKYGLNKDLIEADLTKKGYEFSDSSINIYGDLDSKKPYIYEYEASKMIEEIDSKLYIAPFLSEVLDKNPLNQKSRSYPVDFTYPSTKEYEAEILIPQGYNVSHIPPSKKINNVLFHLDYSAIQESNSIKIIFSYSFKRAIYSSKNYKLIKMYINEIVKKGNEKIAFVKKNPTVSSKD